MLQRTIRTTATLFIALFYDTVKGGDYRAQARQMFTAWLEVSSGIIGPVCGNHVPLARIVECWQIALSVVHRYHVISMQKGQDRTTTSSRATLH